MRRVLGLVHTGSERRSDAKRCGRSDERVSICASLSCITVHTTSEAKRSVATISKCVDIVARTAVFPNVIMDIEALISGECLYNLNI